MQHENTDKVISDLVNHHEINKETSLDDFEPGGKYFIRGCHKTETAEELLPRICGIYKLIRPDFIKITGSSITTPEKKERIKTFIGFMDTICM